TTRPDEGNGCPAALATADASRAGIPCPPRANAELSSGRVAGAAAEASELDPNAALPPASPPPLLLPCVGVSSSVATLARGGGEVLPSRNAPTARSQSSPKGSSVAGLGAGAVSAVVTVTVEIAWRDSSTAAGIPRNSPIAPGTALSLSAPGNRIGET